MVHGRLRSFLGSAAVITAAVASVGVPAPAQTATENNRYVALGDSYSADSGVFPLTPGVNPACLQSARNYPKQVAAQLGLDLTDVTCGGANVGHMTKAQYKNTPPQLDALDGTEAVVTIGIGGNDNNLFASAILMCGAFAPVAVLDKGAPCQQAYGDRFDQLVDADAANIGAALQAIHDRSPDAEVYVVNYPTITPASGRCFGKLPLTTGDTAYLHALQVHLNDMLAAQAAAHDATVIDVFSQSIGHDACKARGVRWVEPPLSGQPVHPGLVGATAQAQIVAAALSH
ncbi:SGNH/GDSL hydrolase family protein [Nocardioides humilatus]|nr:SGNH/GDSL hydrolase family protein [Nocardioides humilatus]